MVATRRSSSSTRIASSSPREERSFDSLPSSNSWSERSYLSLKFTGCFCSLDKTGVDLFSHLDHTDYVSQNVTDMTEDFEMTKSGVITRTWQKFAEVFPMTLSANRVRVRLPDKIAPASPDARRAVCRSFPGCRFYALHQIVVACSLNLLSPLASNLSLGIYCRLIFNHSGISSVDNPATICGIGITESSCGSQLTALRIANHHRLS